MGTNKNRLYRQRILNRIDQVSNSAHNGDSRITINGGSGSGNFGHAGRPGEIGGSQENPGHVIHAYGINYTKQNDGMWKSNTGSQVSQTLVDRWRKLNGVEDIKEGVAPQSKPINQPVNVDKHKVLGSLMTVNRPNKLMITPTIPELYDRIKEQHPGMTEEHFHNVLRQLQNDGKLTMQRFNVGGGGNDLTLEGATGYHESRFPKGTGEGGNYSPYGWIRLR